MKDAPELLKDPSERERRLEMLNALDLKPLTDYLTAVRAAAADHHIPPHYVPNFDPRDGGTNARVLFLLEAPGPKAVASQFVSSNNPDPTAKNLWNLIHDAGIARADTLIWNIVPWYVGTDTKIRPVNSADIQQALPHLKELLSLLPRLKLIVLVGRKAQLAAPQIRLLASLEIKHTFHMSGQVFYRWPEKKKQTEEAFDEIGKFLQTQKSWH